MLRALVESGIKCEFFFEGIYGEDRDKLIARAKIIINMHRVHNHPLEVVRINYLLANKCFVISERGNDEAESAFYEDALVFADHKDLVSKCIEYLTKDREAISSRGREIIRTRPKKAIIEGCLGL